MADRFEKLQTELHALRGRRETLDENREILTTSRAAFAAEGASLDQLVAAHESWRLDIDEIEQALADEDENIKDELRDLKDALQDLRKERRAERSDEDHELDDLTGDLQGLADTVNPPAKKGTKRKK